MGGFQDDREPREKGAYIQGYSSSILSASVSRRWILIKRDAKLSGFYVNFQEHTEHEND